MSDGSSPAAESRKSPRLKLPAMYTLVRVRPAGEARYRWTGYIYDISAHGMRFELDAAVEPGTEVEFRAMLPGAMHTTFAAKGKVVRLHDDINESGPSRMGLNFGDFQQPADRRRLDEYLNFSFAHTPARQAA